MALDRSGPDVDADDRSFEPDPERLDAARRLGREALPALRGGAAAGDVPVHQHARRGVRARPRGACRRRITVQRARVQVRAAHREDPRGHGDEGTDRRCGSTRSARTARGRDATWWNAPSTPDARPSLRRDALPPTRSRPAPRSKASKRRSPSERRVRVSRPWTTRRHSAAALRPCAVSFTTLARASSGSGDPTDVAARFEIVHDEHHALLRDARPTRELCEPCPRPAVDVQEHGGMARPQVGVAAFLERGGQLRGQHAMRFEEQPGEVDVGHAATILPRRDAMVNQPDHQVGSSLMR